LGNAGCHNCGIDIAVPGNFGHRTASDGSPFVLCDNVPIGQKPFAICIKSFDRRLLIIGISMQYFLESEKFDMLPGLILGVGLGLTITGRFRKQKNFSKN
jgi:hypothetical protein